MLYSTLPSPPPYKHAIYVYLPDLVLYHMSVGVNSTLHFKKEGWGGGEKNQKEVTEHILLKEFVSSLPILLRYLNLAT